MTAEGRIRQAVLAVLVPCFMLLGSACVGPQGVPDEALGNVQAVDDLAGKIEKDPSRYDLYPQLVNELLQAGAQGAPKHFLAAREWGVYATLKNPKDWRAWLVRANVERGLWEIAWLLPGSGVSADLLLVESALLEAANLSPRQYEPAQALASFYGETWLADKELAWRKTAVELATGTDLQTAQLALARAHTTRGDYSAAREALAAAGLQAAATGAGGNAPIQNAAGLLHLRLEIAEGKIADGCKRAVELGAKPESRVTDTMVRAATLATSQADTIALADYFTSRLNNTEQPEHRFACLYGLWLCGWVRESMSASPVRPPESDELERRIDEIAPMQQDWAVRNAMAALAGDGGELDNRLRGKLEALGLPAPPRLSNARELIWAWRAEDAMRLQLPRTALAACRELAALYPEEPSWTLLALHARLEAGELEGLAQGISDAAAGAQAPLQAQLTLLRWRTLILGGKARGMLEELKAEGAKEEPLPIDPRNAARLKVLAEFRAVK